MTVLDNYAYLVNKIETAMNQPTLNRFITRPYIDYDHLWVLLGLFEENGTYSHVEDYITSISLVHLALNIHDSIQLQPSTNDQERKLRQLTVLAGDFYSSQYYQLLANQSDFGMIRQVSEAIQKINEYKTNFFKMELPVQRLIELIKQIESALLLHVASYLKLPKWTAFITDYFHVSRLLKEKQAYVNGEATKFLHYALEARPDVKKNVLQTLDETLKQGIERLQLIDLHSFPFTEHLSWYSTCVKPEKNGLSLIAEEG